MRQEKLPKDTWTKTKPTEEIASGIKKDVDSASLKKRGQGIKKGFKYGSMLGLTALGAINIAPVHPIANCVQVEMTEDSFVAAPLALTLPQTEGLFETEEALASYLLQTNYTEGDALYSPIGVINALVLDKDQPFWTEADVTQLKQMAANGDIPQEAQRYLIIAGQLDTLLRDNEALGENRNDLETMVKGLEILIRANTIEGDQGGYVCQHQLIEDIKLYFINYQEKQATVQWGYNLLQEFRESVVAEHLFAGRRLGSHGFDSRFWDEGRLVEANGSNINQAHHFAALFIEGLRRDMMLDVSPYIKSWALDNGIWTTDNPEDRNLSNVAIQLGFAVRRGELSWKDLPPQVIERLQPAK